MVQKSDNSTIFTSHISKLHVNNNRKSESYLHTAHPGIENLIPTLQNNNLNIFLKNPRNKPCKVMTSSTRVIA